MVEFTFPRVFKIRAELAEVYYTQVIQSLAIALIGIFIPIFLLKTGYDLATVILFLVIQWVAAAAFSPLAGRLISRFGFKKSVLLRVPLLVLFFSLLFAVESASPGFLFLAPIAVVGGIAESLYWIAIMAEFMRNTDKLHEGQQAAHLIALPSLAHLAAPLLGALILATLGFTVLFLIVISMLLLSIAPLFLANVYSGAYAFKLSEAKLVIDRRFLLQFFLLGILVIGEGVLWPVFIYTSLQSFLHVGAAAAITALGISFFTLLYGKIVDESDRKRLMRIGTIAYAVTWIGRVFVTTPLEVYFASFLGAMFAAVVMVHIFANFTEFVRGKNILQCTVFRELWFSIGQIVLLVVILLALGASLPLTFLTIGLLMLTLLVV